MRKNLSLGLIAVVVPLVLLSCGDDGLAPQADTTPPTVVSVSPPDGTSAVAIGSTVEVVFSEAVLVVAGGQRAILVSGNGRSIPGAFSVVGENTVSFSPYGALDPGTEYTATVTAGVADTVGNVLEFEHTWTFSTNGTQPPVVSEANLIDLVGILSHDSMAGRGSGSSDELRAAEYIREELEQYGLVPAVPDFFQTFPVPADRVGGQIGVSSQNVLGVIPGEGNLADQWVILGAHYDHVGVRDIGGGATAIFNGADDNASGTAMVIELARVIKEYVDADGPGGVPMRSVMFQLYGAEEIGLLGSEYYCRNPVTALYTVTGMLNFDMVGLLRNDDLRIGGLYTSVQWHPLLVSRNTSQLDLIGEDGFLNSSDHACFRRNNRPAVWFFTGIHGDYHRPTDDVEIVNEQGMKRIGDLAATMVVHLMLRPTPIPFGSPTP